MKRLKHILQHRYLFKVLAVIVIIYAIITVITIKKESIYTNETIFEGSIYKIKKTTNKTIIYMKSKENLVVYYYEDVYNLEIGDKIIVIGTLVKPTNNTIPNKFNYKEYLYIQYS